MIGADKHRVLHIKISDMVDIAVCDIDLVGY